MYVVIQDRIIICIQCHGGHFQSLHRMKQKLFKPKRVNPCRAGTTESLNQHVKHLFAIYNNIALDQLLLFILTFRRSSSLLVFDTSSIIYRWSHLISLTQSLLFCYLGNFFRAKNCYRISNE